MMSLSVAVLEAIKNKAYRLKPVEKTDSKVKNLPKDDLGIGEILNGLHKLVSMYGILLEQEL